MQIIEPSFEIVTYLERESILKKIERAGRIAHKSEDRITPESAEDFVRRLIKMGHESVLEHVEISVIIICDRGVSHELVRHRIASYTQESTRYCDYQKKGELIFIKPCFLQEGTKEYKIWEKAMKAAEEFYFNLRKHGLKPEEARSVLPNSLKTEVFVTANLREWRHIFALRCSPASHPQMREIMIPLLYVFQNRLKPVFDDFDINFDKKTAVKCRK
ncbi:MAG: FAD-dependent thymidylate synthase [Minisyncoccia bacterium]